MNSDDASSDDDDFATMGSRGAARAGSSALLSPAASLLSPPSLWSSSDDDDIPGESDTAGLGGAAPDETHRWIGSQPGARRARPKLVANYVIGAKLGEGAYATVREALNTRTLRICAAKVVDTKKLRRLKGGMEGLKREIRVQKTLQRHANLVELLDVHEDAAKERMYLFMEIANGCAVDALLRRGPNGRLPASQVADIIFQACSGLLAMHRRGIVHRDVKPGNMLLNVDGKLKMSDFGVAEFLDRYNIEDNVTRTSGSPAFQAPEIAKGDDEYSGMKVDVWALGVSAYQLLTGSIPFYADNMVDLFATIARGRYAPLSDSIVDASGRSAIESMLVLDWRERASVEELLKHPWVARAENPPSEARREDEGWVPVPRKHFSVLDLAQRMIDNGELSNSSAVREPESARSRPSAAEGTLQRLFSPSSDPSVSTDALVGDRDDVPQTFEPVGTRSSAPAERRSLGDVFSGFGAHVGKERRQGLPGSSVNNSSGQLCSPDQDIGDASSEVAVENEWRHVVAPHSGVARAVTCVDDRFVVSAGDAFEAPPKRSGEPPTAQIFPSEFARGEVSSAGHDAAVHVALKAGLAGASPQSAAADRSFEEEPDLLASALAIPHNEPLFDVESSFATPPAVGAANPNAAAGSTLPVADKPSMEPEVDLLAGALALPHRTPLALPPQAPSEFVVEPNRGGSEASFDVQAYIADALAVRAAIPAAANPPAPGVATRPRAEPEGNLLGGARALPPRTALPFPPEVASESVADANTARSSDARGTSPTRVDAMPTPLETESPSQPEGATVQSNCILM
jgi:serine/threonine-protein kinase 11